MHCAYCDLQNTGTESVFCPEEGAIRILEDCPTVTILQMIHFENLRINVEDIINQKHSLTTTQLQRIAKLFTKSGCFTKVPKLTQSQFLQKCQQW